MEEVPGPVLYQILKYSGIQTISMFELLSSSVRSKLEANPSAFSYIAKKFIGLSYRSYEKTKEFLKLLGNEKDSEPKGFFPYYTNGG
ncbi:MAG: hypothetical protein V2I33_23890 [Kangiellaceae bacterium]|jgi:hypothetical protein|nr:hypothetical protein [Kangiellaceae bacterium]